MARDAVGITQTLPGALAAMAWALVKGVISKGYGVASGRAPDSPYPEGTIRMQMPFFRERGLDLSGCFEGTLNVSIAPRRFGMRKPEWTFPTVKWCDRCNAETFSFSRCTIRTNQGRLPGFVYYPHPETKPAHFQDTSTLEIIAPLIEGLAYGSSIELLLNTEEIDIA